MNDFNISMLMPSTVLYLHSDRESFQLNPEYQRDSDIWPLEKRQLLIDSIINGYDIPKIYFHKFPKPRTINRKMYTHAIIDGKQRLSSIWSFIDGEISLSENIEYLPDRKIDLSGLTYNELGKEFPKLKTRFDSFPLAVVSIETDNIDLIEDMFSRLNEAVPLSAAEKRNALGGPMPPVIRKLSKEPFFANTLPFGNKRYRHFDLTAKFLLIEDRNKIVDTKKVYLDEFVKSWKGSSTGKANELGQSVMETTTTMAKTFTKSDSLLRSVGMVVLYYHLFRIARANKWLAKITRNKLLAFEKARLENRAIAEGEISKAKYDLLEFDRYTQTPNDAYAMSLRLKILLHHVFDLPLDNEYEV